MLIELPCSSNILLREKSSHLTNPHILILIDPHMVTISSSDTQDGPHLVLATSPLSTNPHILIIIIIIIDPHLCSTQDGDPPGAGDIPPLHGEEELLLREGEWLRSSHRVGGPVAQALLKVKIIKGLFALIIIQTP